MPGTSSAINTYEREESKSLPSLQDYNGEYAVSPIRYIEQKLDQICAVKYNRARLVVTTKQERPYQFIL